MAVYNPNYGAYSNEGTNPYARYQSQGSFYTPSYNQWQYQYNPSQQNQNAINWVQGRAGAEAYLVAPGASVMLMDSTESVLYVKSADSTGRPLPLKVYDLVERTEEGTKSEPVSTPVIDYDRIREIVADEVHKRTSYKKEAK